ncbi:MAG: ABC transporter ATP-binding protein/permease [Clostridia bacterium]|nr:ABC transporter ATP-binding protein/permease [Clostridia bacterium]
MRQKRINIKKFVSYYKPYKGLLAADLFSSVMVAALGLMLPLCVRYVTNDILKLGSEDVLPGILRVGALMLAIITAKTCCGIFFDYKGHDMGAKIERDLRSELFTHYQKLPFSFYDRRNTGELMSRMVNDVHDLSEIYHHVPEMVLNLTIQVVGSVAILLSVDWKLALVALATVPVMTVFSVVFTRRLQKSYKINHERIADIHAIVQENLSGIRTVKALACENTEMLRFNTGNAQYYQSRSSIYKSEALLYAVLEHFLTPFITIAIAIAGGIWISGGTLDIANLLLFIMYAAYLTEPVPRLVSIIPYYQQGFTGYARFREIMETVPEVQDTEHAVPLVVKEGRVTFDNVSFRYSEGREFVLRDINLEVKPGETVAIVGHSGIGKTTLCSLIPRFYDVSGGSIRIDGMDVRDVTQMSLRRQIGMVRQETFLFSGTVMENICYGNPEATREQAIQAAKQTNAHGFIMDLPDGYESDIGQRGVKLSGGQQQRISIARVFLQNPPILIFDEAVSALDYENEKAIMDSLKTLAKGRTVFIIAHRLSMVRNADRIIVLGEEGIIEQGYHVSLYALDGHYTAFCKAQES